MQPTYRWCSSLTDSFLDVASAFVSAKGAVGLYCLLAREIAMRTHLYRAICGLIAVIALLYAVASIFGPGDRSYRFRVEVDARTESAPRR